MFSEDSILNDLRKSIDSIDAAFMNTLAERIRVIEKMDALANQTIFTDSEIISLYAARSHLDIEWTHLFFQRIDEEYIKTRSVRKLQEIQKHLVLWETKEDEFQNFLISQKRLDEILCSLLAERFRVVKQIGYYKVRNSMPTLAPQRWKQVLQNKIEMARSMNIDSLFVKDLFNHIHEQALRIEKEVPDPLSKINHALP